MNRPSPSDSENKIPEDLLGGDDLDFRLLFDQNPQPMWIYDRDSLRFVTVNDAALIHYGYSREEFLGMTIADIRPEEERGAIVELVPRSGDGLRRAGIWRHRLKDGRYILVDITWHSITYEGRRAELALINDITTRKLAEETVELYSAFHERQQAALTQLMQSSALYGGDQLLALQEITEAVARTMIVERASVWRFTEDGGAIVSDAMYELSTGRHSSGVELRAADFPRYFQALHHKKIISATDAANDPRTSEFRDGYLKPLGIHSMLDAPIFVEGRLEGVLCIESTTQMRIWTQAEQSFALSVANLVSLTVAQQARAKSEARARTIVETEPECVKIVSLDGRLVEMNPAGLRMVEADGAEQVLGSAIEGLIHPEDRLSFMAMHRRVCGGKSEMLQFRIVGLKGTVRWMETHAAPLRDAEGRITGALGVSRDITQQRRVLSRLRHREAMLRIAGKVARMGAWAADADDRRIFWSAESCELFGFPVGEIPPREDVIKLFGEESREAFTAAVTTCLDEGTSFDLELECRARDGRLLIGRCRGEAERDSQGLVTRAHGAFQDISEQKISEEKLRRQDALMRIAGKLARVGGWAVSLPGHEVFWSDGMFEILGFSIGRMPPSFEALALYTPESLRLLEEAMDECREAGKPFDVVLQIHTVRGNLLTVRCTGEPEINAHGNVVRVHGAFQDITESVLAEEAIKESEERFRKLLQDVPNVAIQGYAMDGAVQYWNKASEELYGYTAEEALRSNLLDLIIPEPMHERVRAVMKRALETNSNIPSGELTLKRKDGTLVPVYSSHAIVRRAGRKPELFCIDVDMSEQKRLQREVEESREHMQRVFEHAATGICVTSPDGAIVRANAAYCRFLGYSEEELISRDVVSLTHPDDRPHNVELFDELLREERDSYILEKRQIRKDGTIVWGRVSVSAIRDADRMALNIVGVSEDITEQRRLEEEGKRIADRLSSTLEHMSDAFVLIDRDWKYIYLNQESERILQRNRQELIGKSMWEEFPEGRETKAFDEFHRALDTNEPVNFRLHLEPLQQWLEVHAFPTEDGLAIYFRVITERLAMEEQLRQAQRLESIGQLTGGVAHDFNNLLTVIMGNAELLVEELEDREDVRGLAETILKAGRSGADLTRHLLAFARKQALEPKAVDVGELIVRLDGLLRRTLGEDVEIEFVRGAGLWKAVVDPAQLESAVLNLCINARDAMAGGGHLTIETQNITIDQDYAEQHVEVRPGQYVLVAISDTGEGIALENMAKVFEPFFTTKEPGKGTGLGLSMVYGFVKQSRGHVKIYSEPGEGTTVKLYLPRLLSDLEAERQPKDLEAMPEGNEAILLVEDDELVRVFALNQLKALGYTVLEAPNGPAAMEIIRGRDDIELLFTDVVMPGGMNGRHLADAARELYPRLKVLYTSGYTDNAIVHHGRLDPGAHLLGKPYGRMQLARKVREVLDEKH